MKIADSLPKLSSPAEPDTLLRIYLNDHLAICAAERGVARRCRTSNEGTELAEFLETFISDVDEARDVIADVLGAVGGQVSSFKQGAVAVGERFGRLKLNGQLTGYSDLSRVTELQALSATADERRALWQNLVVVAQTDTRLSGFSFDPLIQTATRQRERLEAFRLEAAGRAFTR